MRFGAKFEARLASVANRLPVFLIPKPLAEAITKQRPSTRPTNLGKGMEHGIIRTMVGVDWPPAFGTPYSKRSLALAKKVFGKYMSWQARDKLIAGVEDWHAQLVLIRRILLPQDALAVIRSGKITDQTFLAALAGSTKDEAYAKQTLLSGEFKGWHRTEDALARNIGKSSDAKEILIQENVGSGAQQILAAAIDNSEDAREVLKSSKVSNKHAKETLLAKIEPGWQEKALRAAIAAL